MLKVSFKEIHNCAMSPVENIYNPEEHGKQLHAAVIQEYKRLRASGSLGVKSVDITKIILQYIPVGISFDDAERILRDAGFEVGVRPNAKLLEANAFNLPDPYSVVASLDPDEPSLFNVSLARISVFLKPKSPEDYTKVMEIHAYIGVTYL